MSEFTDYDNLGTTSSPWSEITMESLTEAMEKMKRAMAVQRREEIVNLARHAIIVKDSISDSLCQVTALELQCWLRGVDLPPFVYPDRPTFLATTFERWWLAKLVQYGLIKEFQVINLEPLKPYMEVTPYGDSSQRD